MITEFRGPNMCYSNFYFARQRLSYDGFVVEYKTNEHFFQASKAKTWDQHMEIVKSPSPAIAKRMGSPRGYKMPNGVLFKVDLRNNWVHGVNLDIMRIGIEAKFSQNPDILAILIASHPQTLCEGNYWHDNFWGDCSCPKCLHTQGQNHLGRLLMTYRSTFI